MSNAHVALATPGHGHTLFLARHPQHQCARSPPLHQHHNRLHHICTTLNAAQHCHSTILHIARTMFFLNPRSPAAHGTDAHHSVQQCHDRTCTNSTRESLQNSSASNALHMQTFDHNAFNA